MPATLATLSDAPGAVEAAAPADVEGDAAAAVVAVVPPEAAEVFELDEPHAGSASAAAHKRAPPRIRVVVMPVLRPRTQKGLLRTRAQQVADLREEHRLVA